MAQIILCGGISLVPFIRPVGLYQLACVLRNNGYTVQVIDNFPWIAHLGVDYVLKLFDKFVGPETLWIGIGSTWLMKITNMIGRPESDIKASRHDPIMNELIQNTLLFSNDEIDQIKKFVHKKNNKVKFVMGGARSTLGRGNLCKPLIDCYIEGYADNTVIEYTKYLEGKNPFLPIHRNGDDSISVIHDHKASSFDYGNFEFVWDETDLIMKEEMLPIEIARGCIFNCSFCSYPLNGRKKMDYLKNPKILKKQFISNYEKYGTVDYFFLDDTFNDSVEKLQILQDEVFSQLPFKIRFGSYLRLDLINAHRETVHLLRDMGLASAFFGVESLNYNSNKIVGKGITLEKIIEISEVLNVEWPDTEFSSQFILGLPNDGEKEIRNWLDILLNPDFPLPASQVLPLHLDKNKPKKNIWISKFEEDPAKYGYNFPKENNSSWWVNNKGLSLSDAIQIRKEYDQKYNSVKRSISWLADMGRKNIGISLEECKNNFDWDYPQLWAKKGEFQKRIGFTINYVDRLLRL